MPSNDFKVRPLYPHEVTDKAAKWRHADPATSEKNNFNIIDFLQNIIIPALAERGRPITVALFDEDEEHPARVDVKAKVLFVRRSIWDAADQGQPRARVIIAHEIGHLVLHGEQEAAFTKPYDYGSPILQKLESAEFQANWFAWSLLLPDYRLLNLRQTLDVYSIATVANVEEKLVTLRLEQLELDKRYQASTKDRFCLWCGNRNVVKRNGRIECANCGEINLND